MLRGKYAYLELSSSVTEIENCNPFTVNSLDEYFYLCRNTNPLYSIYGGEDIHREIAKYLTPYDIVKLSSTSTLFAFTNMNHIQSVMRQSKKIERLYGANIMGMTATILLWYPPEVDTYQQWSPPPKVSPRKAHSHSIIVGPSLYLPNFKEIENILKGICDTTDIAERQTGLMECNRLWSVDMWRHSHLVFTKSAKYHNENGDHTDKYFRWMKIFNLRCSRQGTLHSSTCTRLRGSRGNHTWKGKICKCCLGGWRFVTTAASSVYSILGDNFIDGSLEFDNDQEWERVMKNCFEVLHTAPRMFGFHPGMCRTTLYRCRCMLKTCMTIHKILQNRYPQKLSEKHHKLPKLYFDVIPPEIIPEEMVALRECHICGMKDLFDTLVFIPQCDRRLFICKECVF